MRERSAWSCSPARARRGIGWPIGVRGDRYPGGLGIEPEWAQQVMDDVDLVAFEPEPT